LRALLHVPEAVEIAVEHVAGARRDEEDVRVRDPAAAGHETDELRFEDPPQLSRQFVGEGKNVCGFPRGQVMPDGDVPL
jgi:hypothetical protein